MLVEPVSHESACVPDSEDPNDNQVLQVDRPHESETWQSGEQDTSQVSVSSLPEDEKSEPTTATVSSSTATSGDVSLSKAATSEPKARVSAEQRGQSNLLSNCCRDADRETLQTF